MLDKYFEPFIYFLRSFIYKQHAHFTLHTPFHWLMFNWVNTDDLHSYFTVYTTKQWHSTPHILIGKMNYSVVSWCWFHNSMEFTFREMSYAVKLRLTASLVNHLVFARWNRWRAKYHWLCTHTMYDNGSQWEWHSFFIY